MNEPIRHHYIPQFILRNFSADRKHLNYYDKSARSITVKETREIFMSPNLYRDEINHPGDWARIEKDFGNFEREIAGILSGSFLSDDDVIINIEEYEELKLFLALMGVRSLRTSKAFAKNNPSNRQFYKEFQKNGDLTDMWKRNLGYLVNCRSLREVEEHSLIDDPFKMFMHRDVVGYIGRYISIVKSREPFEFVISDAYPTVIYGQLPNGIPIELYSIFPISYNRVLLFPCIGAEGAPASIREMRECIFTPPSAIDNMRLKLRARALYEEEVGFINKQIFSNAETGVAFRSDGAEKKNMHFSDLRQGRGT